MGPALHTLRRCCTHGAVRLFHHGPGGHALHHHLGHSTHSALGAAQAPMWTTVSESANAPFRAVAHSCKEAPGDMNFPVSLRKNRQGQSLTQWSKAESRMLSPSPVYSPAEQSYLFKASGSKKSCGPQVLERKYPMFLLSVQLLLHCFFLPYLKGRNFSPGGKKPKQTNPQPTRKTKTPLKTVYKHKKNPLPAANCTPLTQRDF